MWKSINAGPLGTQWIPNGIQNPLLNWKKNNLTKKESEQFKGLFGSDIKIIGYKQFKVETLAAVEEQDKEAFAHFFAEVEKHKAWEEGEDFMADIPKKNGGRKKKRRRKTKRKSKRKRKTKRKTKRKSKRRRKRKSKRRR